MRDSQPSWLYSEPFPCLDSDPHTYPYIPIHTHTCPACPETRHEMEAEGDGHEFPGRGAALRLPARRLLRQARLSWLATPSLLRGVAGARPAAAGPRARSRADYR